MPPDLLPESPAHGLDRRRWGVWALAGMALVGQPLQAQVDAALPLSRSLPDELRMALARQQALVVMISLDGCPFCRAARQSYLLPLWREGQAMVQLDLRSPAMTRDVDGQAIGHDALIRRWHIGTAPTLVFLGPGGAEVAERMAGAYLPDFYGAYLTARLQQARKRLG